MAILLAIIYEKHIWLTLFTFEVIYQPSIKLSVTYIALSLESYRTLTSKIGQILFALFLEAQSHIQVIQH